MSTNVKNNFDEDDNAPRIPPLLPILPLRDTVIFPFIVSPLIVARPQSVRLINDVLSGDRILGLVTQFSPQTDEPQPDDLYKYGTAAIVLKMLKFPDGTLRVLVQGLNRVKILKYNSIDPYLVANVRVMPEEFEDSKELDALARNISIQFQKVVSLVPQLPDELRSFLNPPEEGLRGFDLIVQDRLPFFTLAHFLAPDSAAHAGGAPGSPGYASAIGEIDVIVDEILDELQKRYPRALLILTADHHVVLRQRGRRLIASPENARSLPIRTPDLPAVQIVADVPVVKAIIGVRGHASGVVLPVYIAGIPLGEAVMTDRDPIVTTKRKEVPLAALGHVSTQRYPPMWPIDRTAMRLP